MKIRLDYFHLSGGMGSWSVFKRKCSDLTYTDVPYKIPIYFNGSDRFVEIRGITLLGDNIYVLDVPSYQPSRVVVFKKEDFSYVTQYPLAELSNSTARAIDNDGSVVYIVTCEGFPV